MEVFLIVWLICGVLCAVVAGSKNRSSGGWFVIGCLTGILGLIAAAGVAAVDPSTPAKPRTFGPRKKDFAVLAAVAGAFLLLAILIG